MTHHESEPQPEPAGRPPLEREDRTAIFKVAFGVLVLVLFVLFIIRNSRPVAVDFVFASVRVRLVWVFLACALIGALVAWLVGRPRRRAQRRLLEEMDRRDR